MPPRRRFRQTPNVFVLPYPKFDTGSRASHVYVMTDSVILAALDPVFWHALLWSIATLTGVGILVQGLIWLFDRRERSNLTGLHCRLNEKKPSKKRPRPAAPRDGGGNNR